MRVEVRSHARLHFGFLDLSGERGRVFGGFGLSLSGPTAVLRFEPARALEVEGEQAERVERLASRFHEVFGLPSRARVRILEAIPEHVGLGSGTQLALAVAAGLGRLHGLAEPPAGLCAAMGRARRSGVGFHLFQRGGFIVEGGHRRRADAAPPLLTRHDFPEDWRVVVAIPSVPGRVSGEAEEEAFRRLRPAPEGTVERIARLVLMQVLPSLVERDLPAFGAALAETQELVGACFAAVQEGPFHPGAARLIRRLKDANACGVGQSSWGPAVYALAADAREQARIESIVRREDPGARLIQARGWNHPAAVEIA